jgi:hypothetical protein
LPRTVPFPRRLLVLSAAASTVAAPAPATASAAKPRPVRIAGGMSRLTLDGGARSLMAGLGATIRPVGHARAVPNGWSFALTYGRLQARTYNGVVRHNGGLRVTLAGRSVDLNNLRLRIDKSPDVTAQIGHGKRISIAQLDLSDAQIAQSRRRLALTGAVLSLRAAGAQALDAALGTDAFQARLRLGTLTVHSRVKRA